MLLVLALILVVSAVTATSFRHLASSARVEHHLTVRESYNEGPLDVAARGVSLLETGQPPANPYYCKATATVNGSTEYYQVVYTSDVSDEWVLEVTPIAASSPLASMPKTFAQIDP